MRCSNYLCIMLGAIIGSLIAIFMGVDPTDVVPIFTAIMVGLVVAFILKSSSEKGSDEHRGASPSPSRGSPSRSPSPRWVVDGGDLWIR